MNMRQSAVRIMRKWHPSVFYINKALKVLKKTKTEWENVREQEKKRERKIDSMIGKEEKIEDRSRENRKNE